MRTGIDLIDPPTRKKTLLNLGCGSAAGKIPGVVNVDIQPFPNVDVVCDLNELWPFEDSSVDGVLACNIVEHLPNKVHVMNEAWRVLKDGGILTVLVPDATRSGWAFADPTHVSYWSLEGFWFFTKEYAYKVQEEGFDGYKRNMGIRCLYRLDDNYEWDNEGNLKVTLKAEKGET